MGVIEPEFDAVGVTVPSTVVVAVALAQGEAEIEGATEAVAQYVGVGEEGAEGEVDRRDVPLTLLLLLTVAHAEDVRAELELAQAVQLPTPERLTEEQAVNDDEVEGDNEKVTETLAPLVFVPPPPPQLLGDTEALPDTVSVDVSPMLSVVLPLALPLTLPEVVSAAEAVPEDDGEPVAIALEVANDSVGAALTEESTETEAVEVTLAKELRLPPRLTPPPEDSVTVAVAEGEGAMLTLIKPEDDSEGEALPQ